MNIINHYYSNGHQVDDLIKEQISNESVRDEFYNSLPKEPSRDLYKLIKALFEQEMIYRVGLWKGTKEDPEDYFENIYLCAYFLYKTGQVEDVYILWEAKYLNMDVGSSLDGNYFLGAGIQETLTFLREQTDDLSKEILNYLEHYNCLEEHKMWENEIIRYHGIGS